MTNTARRLWQGVPIVLLSIWVASLSMQRVLFDSYYRARFGDMIYGAAWRPYVGRSFVPFLIRSVKYFLPRAFEQFVGSFLQQNKKVVWARPTDSFLVERAIFVSLDICALIVFAYGLWRLMRRAALSERWSYITVLLVLGFIPALFKYETYIYDAAQLALFTWALVFLSEQKWVWYTLTYALCIWNKETGILLGLIFLLLHWKELRIGKKRFRTVLAGQVLVGTIVLGAIRMAFSSNVGGVFEWHLSDHNLALLREYSFGTYLTILALLFFILYRFREQELLFQKAVFILPILLGLTLLFGFIDEYRDYYEALPVVATMISVSVEKLVRRSGLVSLS